MTLTIRIENISSKFLSEVPQDVVAMLRLELRYKEEGAQFMKSKWSKNKKGGQLAEYRHLYNKKTKSFPTGLLYMVEDILNKMKISYKKEDTREDKPLLDPISLKTLELRDYQQKTEEIMLKEKCGIVKIATGGGKTAIFTSVLGKLNGYSRVVIVNRQMLLSQTVKVLTQQLGVEVGQIGAGIIDIKPITVAMIPTVSRALDPKFKFVKSDEDDGDDDETELTEQLRESIKNLISDCECIIVDEAHGVAASTAQLIMNYAKSARYRFCVSATPWRSDGKDILIEAVSGPKLVDIDASTLIERGFLVPPHIFFMKTPPCGIDMSRQGKWQDVYKNLVVNNDKRNDLIFDVAKQAYEKCEHIVILIQQIEHGEQLLKRFEEEGMWAEYINGSSTMINREEVMQRFTDKIRGILISSSILNEGIDLPAITTLINAGGGKASAKYYQQIGRAIRTYEDKKRAMVIDFLDRDIKYLGRHAQERIKIVKTESLYKIKIQK